MARLSLAIGDEDEGYLESLTGYLMEHYGQRFRLHTFTKPSSLSSFLSGSGQPVDILLAAPEFYPGLMQPKEGQTQLLLVSGRLGGEVQDKPAVEKYQNADRMVGTILHLYNQEHKNEILIPGGNKKTRIYAVYSPVGGAGKTSIAAGLSIHCAERGASVFYLNLENLNSAADIFKPYGEQTLSHVFFHLKEKDGSLGLKIEGIRCVDQASGVHFFAPPESASEMEEVLPSELQSLLELMKNTGQYDMICVDLSSSLNKRNIALLETADKILLVSVPGTASEEKIKLFFREMEIQSQRSHSSISEKIVRIRNKADAKCLQTLEEVQLPYIDESMEPRIVYHREFQQGIHALAQI